MNLSLTSEQLDKVIAGAILNAIAGPERDAIITKAVESLMRPDTNSYSNRKSPLEEAFARAASSVAYEIMKEEFGKDERLKTRMREVVSTGVEKALFGEDAQRLIEKIASKVTDALYS